MPNIDQFLTDNFHILSYLCNLRDKDGKVSITQQEIADKFGLSRATVNKIIGKLKTGGYIEQDGKHVGRYRINSASIITVTTIQGLYKNNLEE